jgi:hypothetical protein
VEHSRPVIDGMAAQSAQSSGAGARKGVKVTHDDARALVAAPGRNVAPCEQRGATIYFDDEP